MTQNRASAAAPHAWSMKVVVDQIPDTGLHYDLKADPSQRAALCKLAGLRDLPDVSATFDLRHAGRGRVHVTGRIMARVGQICVVTLVSIENTVDESVDLLFAPEDQVAAIIKAMENEVETGGEVPDPPESIVDGTIDLGQLAADALFLGIDPYPRKPDAVFEPPPIMDDPESHPFAALKVLKGESAPTSVKKPKGD